MQNLDLAVVSVLLFLNISTRNLAYFGLLSAANEGSANITVNTTPKKDGESSLRNAKLDFFCTGLSSRLLFDKLSSSLSSFFGVRCGWSVERCE